MRLDCVLVMPLNYSKNYTMPRKKKFKDFPGNLIKIKVLEDEIKFFKSLIQETDTGHIYTTIDSLETRVKQLKGIPTDDPFIQDRESDVNDI